MKMPRLFTRTLAAGARNQIGAFGRHILIVSISASTVEMSLDDGQLEQIIPGQHIDVGEEKYRYIILRNAGAVPTTVIMFVSDVYVDLQSNGGLLGAIAASLASIDQEISGAATCTQLASINVPATGLPGQLLFAANPARTIVSVTGRDDNGGLIFVGDAVTVSHTNWMDIVYPGGNWFEERYKGPVYAVGENANQWVGGYEV